MRPIGLVPNSVGLVSLQERKYGHIEKLSAHWAQRKAHVITPREGGYLQAKERSLRTKISALPP